MNPYKDHIIDEFIPSEFYLGQNFPNPFKEATTIKYCLPVKSKVTLSIFNAEGELIAQLVNEIKKPGTYEKEVKIKDVPAGKYYYVIEAIDLSTELNNTFSETKMMILLR